MKTWRSLVLLVVAIAVPTGGAHATILNDIFTISVYQGPGNGISTNANNQANDVNPLIDPFYLLYSGTYTGAIDFDDGGDNHILPFLESAGGSLSGDPSALSTAVLSTSSFGITTVMDITWTDGNRLAGTIYHDDGASLYLNGNVVVDSAKPTSPTTTSFGLTATGGNYRLIYAAANGLPEVLTVDITQTIVPEPATLTLIGFGLAGAGALRRRKRQA